MNSGRKKSRLINRNVLVAGRRTSMRHEPEVWNALRAICDRRGKPMNAVVTEIAAAKRDGGLTSAVRVFVIQALEGAVNVK